MGYEIITTVVTPATAVSPNLKPYDLTDLATVKDDIGIASTTTDSYINSKITRISQAIYNHCNRVFAVETVQDQIFPARESYPSQVPGGINRLQLSRWPIVSITSVTVQDGTSPATALVAGTDYLSNAKLGQLTRLDPFTNYPTDWYPLTTTVVYSAGYTVIPGDLVDACIRLIRKDYWNRGDDPSIKRHSEGGIDTEYWIATGTDGNFPPDIADLLENYRIPVIA